MEYKIFQMPASLHRIKYAIWDQDSEVSREDFLPVYRGNLQTNLKSDMGILEEIFEIFNINHPKDYVSRSISSGDVVQLNNKDYYLCCSMGWYRLGERFE